MTWANEEFDSDMDKKMDSAKKVIANNTDSVIDKTEKSKPDIVNANIDNKKSELTSDMDLEVKSDIQKPAIVMPNMDNKPISDIKPDLTPKRVTTYNPEYYKLHKEKYKNATARYRAKQKNRRQKNINSAL